MPQPALDRSLHPSARPPRSHARRLAWFVAVGCSAAAVHWTVVVALVRFGQWPPLRANVLGWLLALVVSFCGHYRWTFRDAGAPLRTAAVRFATISGLGFAVNETAYALLLRSGAYRYDLALAGVLVAVAGLTYVLSRHWAFRRRPAP